MLKERKWSDAQKRALKKMGEDALKAKIESRKTVFIIDGDLFPADISTEEIYRAAGMDINDVVAIYDETAA